MYGIQSPNVGFLKNIYFGINSLKELYPEQPICFSD